MTNSEKPTFTAKFPHAPEVEWYFDYQCDGYCCTGRLDVGDNPVDMAVASAIHVASHALARGCGLYGQGLLLVANDLYGYAGL